MNCSIRIIFFSVAMTLFCFSCNNTGNKSGSAPSSLSKVKIGMNYIEVLETAGIPDKKIFVGTVTDETGLQTKTEEWYYGENQLIVIVNDTVNAIDTDISSTYRKIQHIIDSARATGDTSVMIQPVQ
ncbi:MAG: hypothetical protein IPG01_06540 [Chitinophagaceae bacterium]|nr:hypothetical protein [Chitinophagaceae bacterium]